MSKTLAVALSLLVPALAFAAAPATLETRSALHSLVIDVVPVGDAVQYVARVTDLQSGALLASFTLAAGNTTAESFDEKAHRRVRVAVTPMPGSLHASLTVEKDGVAVDAMDSRWSTGPVAPRKGVLRVGGDVKAPVLLQRADPVYPEEARAARISGIVIVEVVIDKNGEVRDAVILKDLPNGLGQAAVDAVKQWKFKPATKDGQPVDVLFNLTVNFRLDAPKNDS